MVNRRILGRAFIDYGVFALLGTVYLLVAVGFVMSQGFAFRNVHLLHPVSLVLVLLYRRSRASYRTYDTSRELLLFLAAVTGVGTLVMAIGGVALHVRAVRQGEATLPFLRE